MKIIRISDLNKVSRMQENDSSYSFSVEFADNNVGWSDNGNQGVVSVTKEERDRLAFIMNEVVSTLREKQATY